MSEQEFIKYKTALAAKLRAAADRLERVKYTDDSYPLILIDGKNFNSFGISEEELVGILRRLQLTTEAGWLPNPVVQMVSQSQLMEQITGDKPTENKETVN